MYVKIAGPKKRYRILRSFFQRNILGPASVYRIIHTAAKRQQGISVIRLGDVMAKLLSRNELDSLQNVSRFLGIPGELYKAGGGQQGVQQGA